MTWTRMTTIDGIWVAAGALHSEAIHIARNVVIQSAFGRLAIQRIIKKTV